MSEIVPLEAIANQRLSIQLEGVRYDFRFHSLGAVMCCDIDLDDVPIVSGLRITGGTPVIPYHYLAYRGGNFFFITTNGDLVWWEKFGITQHLLYLTEAEMGAARAD